MGTYCPKSGVGEIPLKNRLLDEEYDSESRIEYLTGVIRFV